MEFLNALFGDNKTLQAQVEETLNAHPEIKLVNLSDGNYVAKSKYEDDLRAKDTNIKTLTDTIGERDKALGELKKQLESAGTNADALKELQSKFSALEAQAATDKKNYEAAIKLEQYKGACKDFASTLKFKSKADKEHFINSMIAKNMEMDGNKIIGASDYLDSYKKDYADSFAGDDEQPPAPPAPPIDHRQPNPPAPKITLAERMKMANSKK